MVNIDEKMTATEVFKLRRQGHTEEAYQAARQLYATDKSPYTRTAMFWTAVDMLKARAGEGQTEEARKIMLALERLMPDVPDREGWAHDALEICQKQLERAYSRQSLHETGPAHLRMGVWGEEIAAAYLREKGYTIVERDWHSVHRDIDIIARNSECLVFVEVKTRRNSDFGNPVMAVDRKKRRNLRLAMNHYIQYKHIDIPVRFDIITVVGAMDSLHPEINHLEDVNILELQRRW